ncbi:UDP-N-acetylmuramate dehydrogenase [Pseudaeromonas sp. ZJS20]|uniref:UDP-N-acetylmuramate dehydrogenase n=1 Tax=Pseudaeromonas aegiceratis TaxID=3153928 RepID=UPI00390C8E57
MSAQPIADFDLQPYNSFGLAARARWGCEITDLASLQQLLSQPQWRELPRLVIGGGSNLLLSCDFAGLALINRLKGIEVTETAEAWHLQVAAGEDWPALVAWSLQQGMPGLENLALIPGCAGAAPVQNIGAYGVELAQVCEHVDAFDLTEGRLVRLPAEACHFGYRESRFKGEWQHTHIITGIGLRLRKEWQPQCKYGPLAELSQPSAQDIYARVCQLRQAKLPDPARLGNAGSFFKNPTVPRAQADALKADYPAMPLYPADPGMAKLAAGWLIEQAGLKGYRQGQAAVHREQALVLVNLGGASAQELLSLARHVRQTVQARFGLWLDHEVRIMGEAGEWKEALACGD